MEVDRPVAVRIHRAHDALAVGVAHVLARHEAQRELELGAVERAVARRVEAVERLAQPRLARRARAAAAAAAAEQVALPVRQQRKAQPLPRAGGGLFFSLSMSRNMPTANAEDPCRSEGTKTTGLVATLSDAAFRFDPAPSAFAVGTHRKSAKKK